MLELRQSGTYWSRCRFGRVHKARWRGAIVGVKIVNHSPGQQIKDIRILRETLFSTSLLHPNIVVTYKVSRMLQKSCAKQPDDMSELPQVLCGVTTTAVGRSAKASRLL